MKKALKLLIPVLLLVMIFSMSASALSGISADEQKLLDEFQKGNITFKNGDVYTPSADEINQARNLLQEDDVDYSLEQVKASIGSIEDLKAYIKENVNSKSDMTTEQKDVIIQKLREAAKPLDLQVNVNTTAKTVTVLKAGTDTVVGKAVTVNEAIIKKTGAETYATAAVIAAVVSVLGCAVVLGKKVNA